MALLLLQAWAGGPVRSAGLVVEVNGRWQHWDPRLKRQVRRCDCEWRGGCLQVRELVHTLAPWTRRKNLQLASALLWPK